VCHRPCAKSVTAHTKNVAVSTHRHSIGSGKSNGESLVHPVIRGCVRTACAGDVWGPRLGVRLPPRPTPSLDKCNRCGIQAFLPSRIVLLVAASASFLRFVTRLSVGFRDMWKAALLAPLIVAGGTSASPQAGKSESSGSYQ
jgi:hypothetical protein